jgi:hypothetical protein
MTNRIGLYVQTLGAVALAAQVLIAQGCSSSNNPATPGTAGTTGSGAGTAGTTGAAGTSGGWRGSGRHDRLSWRGRDRWRDRDGRVRTAGLPRHDRGGVTLAKGAACTTADPPLCFKTCGPEKAGVKSETCQTGGTYAEMSGCSFDMTGNYSCYKIPTAANTTCPLDADAGTGAYALPQGGQPCTVDHCVLCNTLGGIVGGNYADSTGASKPGYCVCQVPNTSGNRVWSCASDTAWPCPMNGGC